MSDIIVSKLQKGLDSTHSPGFAAVIAKSFRLLDGWLPGGDNFLWRGKNWSHGLNILRDALDQLTNLEVHNQILEYPQVFNCPWIWIRRGAQLTSASVLHPVNHERDRLSGKGHVHALGESPGKVSLHLVREVLDQGRMNGAAHLLLLHSLDVAILQRERVALNPEFDHGSFL